MIAISGESSSSPASWISSIGGTGPTRQTQAGTRSTLRSTGAAGVICSCSPRRRLGHGKKLIRSRLKTRWTLLAKMAFWSMAGLELLVIGFVGSVLPGVWLFLLTLPAFGWWLDKVQRDLRRLVAAFLDETAKGLGFMKLEPKPLLRVNESASSRPPSTPRWHRLGWFLGLIKSKPQTPPRL